MNVQWLSGVAKSSSWYLIWIDIESLKLNDYCLRV